jgi:hypothetical protein
MLHRVRCRPPRAIHAAPYRKKRRRLYLELPQDTPTGEAEVIGFVPAKPEPAVFAPFPTMDELDAKAHEQYLVWKDSGKDPLIELRDSLKGRPIFGVDGVEYQRKIRDEWER